VMEGAGGRRHSPAAFWFSLLVRAMLVSCRGIDGEAKSQVSASEGVLSQAGA
jgi:hypothetical protein